MKKKILILVVFCLLFTSNVFALNDGYRNDTGLKTAFIGVQTFPTDTYPERTGAQNVFVRGYSSDTTAALPIARIFDNQSFTYINNATASDSTLISFVKTGEIKVYEGETYTANIVKYGIGGDTETSIGLIGKIKTITYTKP